MAQRVFSLHGLQSSAGWPTFHLAGGKSVLCQVFQHHVCQKVCRLQHGHHRSVEHTEPPRAVVALHPLQLFIISRILPVIPVCLDYLLKCQNNYLQQIGVVSTVSQVLNPGSNPSFVVCIYPLSLLYFFLSKTGITSQ